jgi:4-nitrophenol 2-monooxygenase / 4-nitrocatechol 4-monooxygenase, reductase component
MDEDGIPLDSNEKELNCKRAEGSFFQQLSYTPQPMTVDDAQFKLAMSHFASGVTVVTTELDGRPYGLTVSSFASLSLHPPLVLVCIEKAVKSHDAIAASKKFGVSILAAEQADVSTRFASRSDEKFAGLTIRRGETGLPLIDDALCTVECAVRAQLPGGDHSIFVGEVLATHAREGAPLVYFRSGYRNINA